MWTIEFYEKENGKIPVRDFLIDLPRKHRAKALNEIELLEEFGIAIQMPHARQMGGNLWELRIKFSSDISRIFYFIPMGRKIVLLHGFIKKTQKTSPEELRRAKRYMEDWERRHKHES